MEAGMFKKDRSRHYH